jgi:hypothetical protein
MASFSTLAERFEVTSKQIYGSFAARTDDSGQPFVSVKPDTPDAKTQIKDDIRLVPFSVSARRDVTRISRFLKTNQGVIFLTKQTGLQLFNTFENTKTYAVTSVLANVTIPTSHVSRISSIGAPSRRAGLLQNTTVTNVASKFTIQNSINDIVRNTTGLGAPGGFTQFKRTVVSLASIWLKSTVNERVSRIKPQYTGNVNSREDNTRPEFSSFVPSGGTLTNNYSPRLFLPQPLVDRSNVKLSANAVATRTIRSVTRTFVRNTAIRFVQRISRNKLFKNVSSAVPLITPQESFNQDVYATATQTDFLLAVNQFKQSFEKNNQRYINNTLPADTPRLNSKYITERNRIAWSQGSGPDLTLAGWGQSDISDSYNLSTAPKGTNEKLTYTNISGTQPQKSDIINFAFQTVDNTVQFRALISRIKENIKPEFTEKRYIGRTERFVTYAGVKRSVSLSFNIVAFSQNEIDNMWTRVNYLTGLAFPKGISTSGFIIPPLFKITVGGLYNSQPCYIDTLDYDFLDETITFDIDKEVPHAINVNMTVSILEKRSKFHTSPFYQITENFR